MMCNIERSLTSYHIEVKMKVLVMVTLVALVSSMAALYTGAITFKYFTGTFPWEKPTKPQQLIRNSDYM